MGCCSLRRPFPQVYASNTKEPPLLSLKASLLAGLAWKKGSWQFRSWESTLWSYTMSSGSQKYSLIAYIQRGSARGRSQLPDYHWQLQFSLGNPCPVSFAFYSSEPAQSESCLEGNCSCTWMFNIIISPLYVPYSFCNWLIWFCCCWLINNSGITPYQSLNFCEQKSEMGICYLEV